MPEDNIIKILQASVAPCLLISGFGFLLLTMTNRLGRGADRIRQLIQVMKTTEGKEKGFLREEVDIIYQRCHYLRSAIALLVFSIMGVAVNVLLLFASIVTGTDLTIAIELLFVISLVSLIVSLILFLVDITLTLKSLRIEIANQS